MLLGTSTGHELLSLVTTTSAALQQGLSHNLEHLTIPHHLHLQTHANSVSNQHAVPLLAFDVVPRVHLSTYNSTVKGVNSYTRTQSERTYYMVSADCMHLDKSEQQSNIATLPPHQLVANVSLHRDKEYFGYICVSAC